jgi:hypothetical protein
MANRRLPMRKIKEVLRLKYDCNLSERGVITYCEEAGELEGMVEEYAEYQNYKIPKHKYYKYRSLHH